MLTTSSKPREKANAIGYLFPLLSSLLRQLSLTHNGRRNLVSTCQQPIQTYRRTQVHTITSFNHLHPRPMTNTVVHDRWRNYHPDRHTLPSHSPLPPPPSLPPP